MSLSSEEILEKLKGALSLVENLREENESYKKSFEQIKVSHSGLAEKFESLSRDYHVISKEKELIEVETSNNIAFWKEQFENKERELDEFRTRGPSSKILDLVKLELREELESAQNAKLSVLTNECEKYRKLYYKIKRDLETSLLDNERMESNHKREIDDINRLRREDKSHLESKLTLLQQSLDETSDTTRLRTTQRENNELQVRITSLLSELEQAQALKEQLRVEFEQSERVHKRQLADQLNSVKTIQTEKDSLVARVASLENDLHDSHRRQDDLSAENSRLSKELDKAMSQIEEAAHKFNVEVSDMKLSTLKIQSEHDNVIASLKGKISELQSVVKTLNSTIEELRAKSHQTEKEYMDRVRLAREEEWIKMSKIEGEKAEVERHNNKLEQRVNELENRDDQIRSELNLEIEHLKKELQTLLASNENINTKYQNTIAERERIHAEQKHLHQKVQELDLKLANATSEMELSRRSAQSMSEKTIELEAAVSRLEKTNEDQSLQYQKEQEAFQHNFERQKNTWLQEKMQLAQKIERLVKENADYVYKVEELETLLDKQHKIFEAKLVSLKDRVKSYKLESSELRKTLDDEHRIMRSQLEENKQKQAKFRAFLQNEGLFAKAK